MDFSLKGRCAHIVAARESPRTMKGSVTNSCLGVRQRDRMMKPVAGSLASRAVHPSSLARPAPRRQTFEVRAGCSESGLSGSLRGAQQRGSLARSGSLPDANIRITSREAVKATTELMSRNVRPAAGARRWRLAFRVEGCSLVETIRESLGQLGRRVDQTPMGWWIELAPLPARPLHPL